MRSSLGQRVNMHERAKVLMVTESVAGRQSLRRRVEFARVMNRQVAKAAKWKKDEPRDSNRQGRQVDRKAFGFAWSR